MKIIDIHCHMFNLKYLPVAGILVRYGNGLITHKIAIGIEWLLLKNTKQSFPLYDNSLDIDNQNGHQKESTYHFLDVEKMHFTIQDILDFDSQKIVQSITQMTQVDDLLNGDLKLALDEFEILNKKELGNYYKNNFATEKDMLSYRLGLLNKMLHWIIDKVNSLENYLRWFVFMTNSEEDIYNHITNKDEKIVLKFVHLMMDVDHFFNESAHTLIYESYFNFANRQVDNMHRLMSKHDNLIGFVAFNPARADTMDIIKKAISEYKFIGVKFYPPLGYQPDNDEVYSTEIETLFTYCAANKIPVFTHCNNKGFEAWPKPIYSGYKSNPKFWEQTLIKHPNLILCLGHAGGTQGWFSENKRGDETDPNKIFAKYILDNSENQSKDWNHSYAALVFKLCVICENVYCDASYLDEMIDTNGGIDETKKEIFITRLSKLFKEQPKFAKRIMYGSDWHMLFQEGKNAVYLQTYIDLFNDDRLLKYSDDFFFNNALNYLNLKNSIDTDQSV